MTRAFAVLPPGTVRGIGNHQIIEIIHRMPANIATTGALALLGAGALLLAAVQLRERHGYAQGYIDGIEYRYLSSPTESDTDPRPSA